MRQDGTISWQNYGNQGDFFPGHDLTHCAVETILGYRHAFYGMIASGRELEDFGSGDAASFHPEAIYSESLVGLLTTAELRGTILPFEEIKRTIDEKTSEAGFLPMELTEADVLRIRVKSQELKERWTKLPAGTELVLDFDETK